MKRYTRATNSSAMIFVRLYAAIFACHDVGKAPYVVITSCRELQHSGPAMFELCDIDVLRSKLGIIEHSDIQGTTGRGACYKSGVSDQLRRLCDMKVNRHQHCTVDRHQATERSQADKKLTQ